MKNTVVTKRTTSAEAYKRADKLIAKINLMLERAATEISRETGSAVRAVPASIYHENASLIENFWAKGRFERTYLKLVVNICFANNNYHRIAQDKRALVENAGYINEKTGYYANDKCDVNFNESSIEEMYDLSYLAKKIEKVAHEAIIEQKRIMKEENQISMNLSDIAEAIVNEETTAKRAFDYLVELKKTVLTQKQEKRYISKAMSQFKKADKEAYLFAMNALAQLSFTEAYLRDDVKQHSLIYAVIQLCDIVTVAQAAKRENCVFAAEDYEYKDVVHLYTTVQSYSQRFSAFRAVTKKNIIADIATVKKYDDVKVATVCKIVLKASEIKKVDTNMHEINELLRTTDTKAIYSEKFGFLLNIDNILQDEKLDEIDKKSEAKFRTKLKNAGIEVERVKIYE